MKHLFTLLLLTTLIIEGSPLFAGGQWLSKGLSKLGHKSSPVVEHSLRAKIASLERQNKALAAANARERKYQSALFDKARRATFRALPKVRTDANAFTGTTFQVIHEGKKEIFGVVAAHTIQDLVELPGLLGIKFNAIFVKGNTVKSVPAEIVQITPRSMGDLALVKFPAEYESFMDPIPLENVELTLPAQGYSQGYAQNLLSKQTFPIVGQNSLGTLTAQLPPVEFGQRSGLCGSPVFSTNFRLAGIHIGSSYETNVGFITPISVLQNLVKSYYTPGLKLQTIKLAGKEIGQLAMDEYVASVEMLNAQQQVIWKQETGFKFSLAKAEAEIAKRKDVAFIRVKTGRAILAKEPTRSYVIYDAVYRARIITTPWTENKNLDLEQN